MILLLPKTSLTTSEETGKEGESERDIKLREIQNKEAQPTII